MSGLDGMGLDLWTTWQLEHRLGVAKTKADIFICFVQPRQLISFIDVICWSQLITRMSDFWLKNKTLPYFLICGLGILKVWNFVIYLPDPHHHLFVKHMSLQCSYLQLPAESHLSISYLSPENIFLFSPENISSFFPENISPPLSPRPVAAVILRTLLIFWWRQLIYVSVLTTRNIKTKSGLL